MPLSNASIFISTLHALDNSTYGSLSTPQADLNSTATQAFPSFLFHTFISFGSTKFLRVPFICAVSLTYIVSSSLFISIASLSSSSHISNFGSLTIIVFQTCRLSAKRLNTFSCFPLIFNIPSHQFGIYFPSLSPKTDIHPHF